MKTNVSILFFALCLCLVCSSIQAQLSDQNIRQVFPDNPFYYMEINYLDFAPEGNGIGYAVGNCATILKTSNNGQSWELQDNVLDGELHTVTIFPESQGNTLVILSDDNIYQSTDGGKSWTSFSLEEELEVSEYPQKAHPITTDKLIFETNKNDIFIFDLGNQQLERTLQNSGNQKATMDFVNDSVGWTGSAQGRLFRTNDRGYHWEVVYTNFPSIKHVDFWDEHIGYIFADGNVYKTTDQGRSWFLFAATFLSSSANIQLLAMGQNEAWIRTWNKLLRLTPDQNPVASDAVIPVPIYPHVSKAFLQSEDKLWLVGSSSTLMSATNRGTNWELPFDFYPHRLDFLLFPSKDEIVTWGSNSDILYSKDYGANWEKISKPIASGFRSSTSLADGSLFFTSISNVFRYDGQNWTEALGNDLSIRSRILFISSDYEKKNLFLVHMNAFGGSDLLRSTDKGLNWEYIHSFNFFCNGLSFTAEGTIYAYGFPGDLDRSDDLGESWTAILSNEPLPLTHASFLNARQGVLTSNQKFITTEDGGLNFKSHDIFFFGRIEMAAPGKLWALHASLQGEFHLMNSQNWGQSWDSLSMGCARPVKIRTNPYTHDLWMVGYDGGISVISNNTNNHLPIVSPGNIRVYPNPGIGLFELDFSGLATPITRVDLFTIDGKFIDSYPHDGQLRKTLILDDLPMGAYLIRAQGTNSTQTVKIIIQ